MMLEPPGAAHLDHNRSFSPSVPDGSVSPTRHVLGARGHEHRAVVECRQTADHHRHPLAIYALLLVALASLRRASTRPGERGPLSAEDTLDERPQKAWNVGVAGSPSSDS
eukprot:3020314-Pyramimonas_sp.AAC.1